MYVVYNRLSLTIVDCINFLKAQPSFISIYIEYLGKKNFIGYDNIHFKPKSYKLEFLEKLVV